MTSSCSPTLRPVSTLSLLLFLAWSPQDVFSTCRSGTAQECTSAPFVPGHHLSGRGFDVVSMQHTEGSVLDTQTFLTPTNSCSVCTNPLFGNGLQKLPSVMLSWSSESSCDPLSGSAHTSVGSLVGGLSSPVVGSEWRKALGLQGFTTQQLAGTGSAVARFASSRATSDKTHFTLHQMSCSHYT